MECHTNGLELILFPYISLLGLAAVRIAKCFTLHSTWYGLTCVPAGWSCRWLAVAGESVPRCQAVSPLKTVGSRPGCHGSERSVKCPQGLGSFHFLSLSKCTFKIPGEKQSVCKEHRALTWFSSPGGFKLGKTPPVPVSESQNRRWGFTCRVLELEAI